MLEKAENTKHNAGKAECSLIRGLLMAVSPFRGLNCYSHSVPHCAPNSGRADRHGNLCTPRAGSEIDDRDCLNFPCLCSHPQVPPKWNSCMAVNQELVAPVGNHATTNLVCDNRDHGYAPSPSFATNVDAFPPCSSSNFDPSVKQQIDEFENLIMKLDQLNSMQARNWGSAEQTLTQPSPQQMIYECQNSPHPIVSNSGSELVHAVIQTNSSVEMPLEHNRPSSSSVDDEFETLLEENPSLLDLPVSNNSNDCHKQLNCSCDSGLDGSVSPAASCTDRGFSGQQVHSFPGYNLAPNEVGEGPVDVRNDTHSAAQTRNVCFSPDCHLDTASGVSRSGEMVFKVEDSSLYGLTSPRPLRNHG